MMPQPPTRAPSLPPETRIQRLRNMLARIASHGVALAGSLVQAYGAAPAQSAPPPGADPVVAFTRAARAVRWVIVLSELLAGIYRLPTARARPVAPATPAPATPTRPIPSSLDSPDRAARDEEASTIEAASKVRYRTDDQYMNFVFATRPIGEIAARLCRDLGIAEHSELWPAEIVALTQTPAEWSAAALLRPPEPNFAASEQPRAPHRAPAPRKRRTAQRLRSAGWSVPSQASGPAATAYARHQPP